MSFDAQADVFEERAGLPEVACRQIAEAVLALAGPAATDLLVEIGPGTGQIGCELAHRVPRYLGVDSSERMLAHFRRRLGAATARLEIADAGAAWPVADGAARCVFGSRSLHLLSAAHVASEAARVTARPGVLLVGRVEREPGSAREMLRKRLRQRLGARAFRSGRAHTDELLEQCERLGAIHLPPVVAARWASEQSACEVLAGWAQNPDLGKTALAVAERDALLAELRAWAEHELGGLDRAEPWTEAYVLRGARWA